MSARYERLPQEDAEQPIRVTLNVVQPPAAAREANPPAYSTVEVTLPSYDDVRRQKEAMGEALPAVVAARTTPASPTVAGMLLGDDLTFICTFLVSFFLSWLGYLFCFCLGQSIAARSGALSGFGLSLVKVALIMKHMNDVLNAHGHDADEGSDDMVMVSTTALPEMEDEHIHHLHPIHYPSWAIVLLAIMGFIFVFRGIGFYVEAKRLYRISMLA
eukprot:m.287577 g.287577  ORF g.287577 m.287577 type:complete len:216 (-) comp11805_c0_seq1:259-906(-)